MVGGDKRLSGESACLHFLPTESGYNFMILSYIFRKDTPVRWYGGLMMTRLWNWIKNICRLNNRNNERTWQSYYDEEPDYTWLKKIIAAVALFALVYGAHISGTWVGMEVTSAVRQMLITQTDFVYYTERTFEYVNRYWPNAVNSPVMPVLKQVQATMARPADPLRYMIKPVTGQIIIPYGWQKNQAPKGAVFHDGITISAPLGNGVQAAAGGRVKMVTDSAVLGRMLIIDHGQGIETIYGHLSEVIVKEGDDISLGQIVARTGKSGSAAAELYFELRENGAAVDPLTRIKDEFNK